MDINQLDAEYDLLPGLCGERALGVPVYRADDVDEWLDFYERLVAAMLDEVEGAHELATKVRGDTDK